MIELAFDLRKFDGDVEAAVDAIVAGAERGLDRAANVLLGHKRRRQQAGTYSRPERIGASGEPEWVRSDNWLKQQQVVNSGPLERTVGTVGSAEKYERRLADLPTGPDGINRTNDAGGDAARIFEPQFGPLIEEGVSTELRNRGLS